MKAGIRLGKISSIDYAKGMARVVYHEKDDDVTRLIPLLSHEYKMPPVGSQVLVVHLSNGTEAGGGAGAAVERKEPAAGGRAALYRKDLGQSPGEAMIPLRRQHPDHQMRRSHQHRGGWRHQHQRRHHRPELRRRDHAGSGKNYGYGGRDHRRGTFGTRPPHPRSRSAGKFPGPVRPPCGSTAWPPLRWGAPPPSGTGAVGPARAPWAPGAGP